MLRGARFSRGSRPDGGENHSASGADDPHSRAAGRIFRPAQGWAGQGEGFPDGLLHAEKREAPAMARPCHGGGVRPGLYREFRHFDRRPGSE